jgi:DNA-directed RNA polymerase subunit alpha
MSQTDQILDLDRALDSAVSDVGEALNLRQRAASDSHFRRGLKGRLEGVSLVNEGMDAASSARRAAAHFILGMDERVGEHAVHGDTHRVRHLWGLSELYRDRPIAAANALAAAVEMEPRDEQARLQLASTQALLGQADDARATLGDLAAQEDRAPVLFALGTIAEAEGDYDGAERYYQNALVQDPQHVDSLFRLAYQHDLSGEDEAAIVLYERARNAKPTRVNVLMNLGVLYEDRGDFRKAAECYREVLNHLPNHPRARAFVRDADSSISMVMDDDLDRKEDRRNQLLMTPITEFELSVRSRNCLAKMLISTLGDLITRTEAELLSYKNFGETSLQEIKDILNSKGLRLGMRREDIVVAVPTEPEEMMPAIPEMPDVDDADMASKLNKPISDLDLSVRSSKCMAMLGITTVGQLLQHSVGELLRSKNFGQTSLHEIETKLASMGLALRK